MASQQRWAKFVLLSHITTIRNMETRTTGTLQGNNKEDIVGRT
jgi:hypothetical protein